MGYLICEKCSGYYELQEDESPDEFGQCQCGGNLSYVETIEEDKSVINKFKSSSTVLRILGVLLGALIMFVPYYLFSADTHSELFVYNNSTSLVLWGLGGLVASFIAGGKIRNGISNGFYAAVISGFLIIYLFYYFWSNYFHEPTLADNMAFLAALSVVYILVPSIFSMLGGLIGMLARKIMEKLF